ncbi:MAG: hypothetical protein IPH76_11470 [Xanthomonadales bacterium]|jgi:hypothetical protein|nr:hypothetical protein [Xanthomonadales bacterium]
MKHEAVLAHVQDGEHHSVAAELRVLVAPGRNGGFIAHGIEIDYVATADTEEAVRQRFAEGFIATVRSLIRRGRPLDSLFASRAPASAIAAYFASEKHDVFFCAIGEALPDLPKGSAIPRHLAFVSAPSLAA